MPSARLTLEAESGTLSQLGIRYVLMRPDVIMGALNHLESPATVVEAMKKSAFENARGSFSRYIETGFSDGVDPIEHACRMAGQLGWGEWRVTRRAAASYAVSVSNSPFIAGVEVRDVKLCGWIAGVLKAAAAASFGEHVEADEIGCACMGASHCEFEISLDVACGN